MSIPVLIQTYDEARRLAIAGAGVAPGDFRLKNLIPALERAGSKAPVFAKVAETVARVVESDEQGAPAALLDLTSLVGSILHTRGETGIEGELAPLPTAATERPRTGTSSRLLKPIREALTSRGGGRLEVICDGLERGAFQDFRLIAPAVAALDDGYAEIAELVAEKILPLYGPAIVPELAKGFDPKGKGNQARRLTLMHRLDPEAARVHVLNALDEGPPDLRAAAVGCLSDSPADLPLWLEHAKSKAKVVRVAALEALARVDSDEAAGALRDAIAKSDLAPAVGALRKSRHPAVTAALLDEAEKQRDALLDGKDGDAKAIARQTRMGLILECLRDREDDRTAEILLSLLKRAERFAKTHAGTEMVYRLVSVMASGSPRVQDALIEAHATLSPQQLTIAFAAARRSRSPAEVFEMFHPYLLAKADEKNKGRVAGMEKRKAIAGGLSHGAWWMVSDEERRAAIRDLDPRWLDLAIQVGELDLVRTLAAPGHDGALRFLREIFQQENERPGISSELHSVIGAMIQIDHPEATDAVVEVLKKLATARGGSGFYWFYNTIGHMVPRLPAAEAVPKLEALLPTLPEPLVDQLIGPVNELKRAGADEDLQTKG